MDIDIKTQSIRQILLIAYILATQVKEVLINCI